MRFAIPYENELPYKRKHNMNQPFERSIIHLNVADFAVAVERSLDPRLQDRPVVIAPEGAVRAAVYDMSEEAYQCGVRKGMALRRALRCCRDIHVLPPHPDRYEQAMRDLLRQTLVRVFKLLQPFDLLVLSI